MTHSSGIPVNDELHNAFAEARTSGSARWISVRIEDETLVLDGQGAKSGTDQEDWPSFASKLQPKRATYILYQLDVKNDSGFIWVCCAYVPDGSPVRDRMLYASTRDLLKKQLGYNYFGHEIQGSTPEEFTWEGFIAVKEKHKVAAPLTSAEREKAHVSQLEVHHGTTREYVHSVAFAVQPPAAEAITAFAQESNNYVQLYVDTEKETIELSDKGDLSIGELSGVIPDDHPRFTVFRWNHTHEDEQHKSIVFVYSCPDNAPVKEKMLYSTVKAVAAGEIEAAGVKIHKKLEVTEGADVTEKDIQLEVHPPVVQKTKRIARPKRAGRGPSRMTRKK